MNRITVILTEKTANFTYYSVIVNDTEAHLFKVRSNDEGKSMERILDYIKLTFEKLEENLQ